MFLISECCTTKCWALRTRLLPFRKRSTVAVVQGLALLPAVVYKGCCGEVCKVLESVFIFDMWGQIFVALAGHLLFVCLFDGCRGSEMVELHACLNGYLCVMMNPG